MGSLGRVLIEAITLVICIYSFAITWLVSFLSASKKINSSKAANKVIISNGSASGKGKLSIVIAVKNEARYIGKTIRNLESTTIDKARVEIVLVDAGCKDNTMDVARASSGSIPLVQVKQTVKHGRGTSLNRGAEAASGDLLLFLRADCLVPPGYDETIRRELKDTSVCLVSFMFGYAKGDLPEAPSALWIIEAFYNLRASLCSLPLGAHGFATTMTTFQRHQFSDSIILEDLRYVQAVREHCRKTGQRMKLLSQSVLCTADDIIRTGVLKYTIVEQLAHLLHLVFHASDEFIYRWCYIRLPHVLKFLTP